MRETSPEIPAPWRVLVALEDIPETGQRFDLVADADVRAAVCRLAGLRDLPRLEAHFDVTRQGSDGLRVAGSVSATVGQTCVVTLEPLVNEVEEEVDLVFAARPSAEPKSGDSQTPERSPEATCSPDAWGEPEPLVGGVIDLGALATEFLILGLDPYPRKPGAVFEPPRSSKSQDGPFAVLAQLTKGRDGG